MNPVRRVEAVAFDLDGTLIDSEAVNIEATKMTFESLGFPLLSHEAFGIPGRASRDFIPPLLEARGITGRNDEIITQNRANYDALWSSKSRIILGTVPLLTRLEKLGLPLALTTTNRRTVVERFLAKLGLGRNPFQVIVTSEDVSRFKPDPEAYTLTAKRLQIQPNRILAVEDTAFGVESAKKAGLIVVAIPSALSTRHDFSGADYLRRGLHELILLVESLR